MQPQSFAYWLQGFVELTNGQMPTSTQWQTIMDHVEEVNRAAAAKAVPASPSELFDLGDISGVTGLGFRDSAFHINVC